MYAGLTPEVWTLVLRHVQKPVPPVNSGPEARIDQHDLASCMRVSVVFNDLTAPILYQRVVIEATPKLFYGATGPIATCLPAHPDVRNKVKLLQLIRHLQLEYPALDPRPTMTDILASTAKRTLSVARLWSIVDRAPDRAYDVARIMAMIMHLWTTMAGDDNRGKVLLKNVVTLAFCAIRGEDPIWGEILAGTAGDRMTQMMVQGKQLRLQQNWIASLITELDIKQFCSRAAHGPLRLAPWAALAIDRFRGTPRRDALLTTYKKVGDNHACIPLDAKTSSAIERLAKYTADPQIVIHFREFHQLSFIGNAHVHHIHEPDAEPILYDEEQTHVLDPAIYNLKNRYEEAPRNTLQYGSNAIMAPRVHIYAHCYSREATPPKQQRESTADDVQAAQWTARDLNMIFTSAIPLQVDIKWHLPQKAPSCDACGC